MKTLNKLFNKANQKGYARINGRMSLGFGVVGDLEEKYSISIDGDILTLSHWGTITLEFNMKENEIIYFYGESASDRNSMNYILDLLGYRKLFFRYSHANGFRISDYNFNEYWSMEELKQNF